MLCPLQGIRAIDCGIFHAGPGALAILGDLGAEVIKIEQPRIGDPVRELNRFGTMSFEFKGRSMFFEGANRHKKSITLNLKTEKGQEILHRLVAKCDVFVTNYRRDAVERLGLTYPVLRKLNPSLIYAYVSGNGSLGADSKRGGFDQQGQARSGLMFSVGNNSMPPLLLQFGIMDQVTAMVVSHGILTALLMRERFGVGQEIDASILGSSMFAQYFNVLTPLVTGRDVPRYDRSDTDPLRNYYCCLDGKWISIQAIPRHADNWEICCRLIGRDDLKADPRFDTDDKRMENRHELIPILDEAFKTKPRDEWHRLFGQYDFISSPVNKPFDLKDDPQVTENGYIVDCDHPVFGKTQVPGYPIRFGEAQTSPYVAAPDLGEHTEEVLREIGYSDAEIRQFKEKGVV